MITWRELIEKAREFPDSQLDQPVVVHLYEKDLYFKTDLDLGEYVDGDGETSISDSEEIPESSQIILRF